MNINVVGDPNCIERVGMDLFGGKSDKIFEIVMDEDLKSLYPSIPIAFNIDTTTQFGLARFTNQINDEESIEFFDYMGARNYVSMGAKYFNLPSAEEIADLDL